jgi:hypothetical protein
MRPDRLGLVIGATFGLVYVEVNAHAVSSPIGPLLQVLGVIAYVGVLVALRRASMTQTGEGPARPGFGRGYWLVVVAEVAAFAGGNALLNGPLDLPQGVLPWISFVVGVHFIGLAKVWHEASLGWVGSGIAVLGVLGLGLAWADASHTAIALIAGVGPGVVLLAASGWAAAHGRDGVPASQPI